MKHESAVRRPIEATEPEQGGTQWRAADADAFAQVDFSQADIRQALQAAYRVLLQYRARRLSEPSEGRMDTGADSHAARRP